jgi:predicted membrane protein
MILQVGLDELQAYWLFSFYHHVIYMLSLYTYSSVLSVLNFSIYLNNFYKRLTCFWGIQLTICYTAAGVGEHREEVVHARAR